MTTTTAATTKDVTLADALARMDEFRADLAAAIAEDHYNGSTDWVVGFPQHVIFCKVNDVLPDGRVKNMATTGILYATRMDRDSAERATARGNIRNGLGEWAEAISYRAALYKTLDHVEATMRTLRDHSATA